MVGSLSASRACMKKQMPPGLVHILYGNLKLVGELKPAGTMGRGFGMSLRSSETAIDEIVARCDGDIRGALKALLLVNEHLEAEIAQLYAAASLYGVTERSSALH
jgi:hypothetical protein